MTVGDPLEPLTWEQLAMRYRDEALDAQRFKNLLSDLDRCQHGRHEGDVCGGITGCNGPSQGNPLLPQRGLLTETLHRTNNAGTSVPYTVARRQIGYTMDRRAIVVPERGAPGKHNDASTWVQ